ncbi:MAG: hypothetical protein HYW49_01765 [Deltaproteobacteria bacterium]|nr:hypothetical protein [Deltaproteobacteria bacterium]
MMKKNVLVIAVAFCALASLRAHAQCTDFSGEYVVPAKQCYFSNQIRPELVFGLRGSSTFVIQQEGCEKMSLNFVDAEGAEQSIDVDMHASREVERKGLSWHIQKVKNRRLSRTFIFNETYIGGLPPIVWFWGGAWAKIRKTWRGNLVLSFGDPGGAIFIGPMPIMAAGGGGATCKLRNKSNLN